MSYYLSTFEGLGNFGYVSLYLSYPLIQQFEKIVDKYFKEGYSIRDRYILAVKDYTENNLKYATSSDIKSYLDLILDYITDLDNTPGVTGYGDIAKGLRSYEANKIRERRNEETIEQRRSGLETAAKQKAEAEEAKRIEEEEQQRLYNIAMQEIKEQRAKIEAERKEGEEQARIIMEAESAAYENLKNEVLENINLITAGQYILTDPEQIAIYEDVTGRNYYDVIREDEDAVEFFEQETGKTIDREDNMEQQIEIGTQLITSGKEYSIISEDENVIVYQDENGKMYIEEKAGDGGLWLLLAAAGLILLV